MIFPIIGLRIFDGTDFKTKIFFSLNKVLDLIISNVSNSVCDKAYVVEYYDISSFQITSKYIRLLHWKDSNGEDRYNLSHTIETKDKEYLILELNKLRRA